MSKGLLRLVHSRGQREQGPQFALRITVTSASGAPIERIVEGDGPRAFVIGSGERSDLAVPVATMPRHLALLVFPELTGPRLRLIALHPERTLTSPDFDGGTYGALEARHAIKAHFGDYTVFVAPTDEESLALPQPHYGFPPGDQLSFFQNAPVRPVGDVLSSVGSKGGSFAVPALVSQEQGAPLARTLVLYGKGGVSEFVPTNDELLRGVLVGRSRRCVLGRGFDETDGLSRVHGLVMQWDDEVYIFDLASRYGIRDVSRPARLLPVARLDDGIGCLVYGAGHLIAE